MSSERAAGRRDSGQFSIAVDNGPWGCVYQAVIGFLMLPVWSVLSGSHRSGWALPVFFLATLMALRVVPAAVRMIVPFPEAVRAIWAERRQLAKRYDSYQWQKLFWIGIGLALSTAVAGRVRLSEVILAAACLLAGGAGRLRWRYHTARDRVPCSLAVRCTVSATRRSGGAG